MSAQDGIASIMPKILAAAKCDVRDWDYYEYRHGVSYDLQDAELVIILRPKDGAKT